MHLYNPTFIYSWPCVSPSLPPDVYHMVFDPPRSQEVAARLVSEGEGEGEEGGGGDGGMRERLRAYHRQCGPTLSCYASITKRFNADQPLNDILDQGEGVRLWGCEAVRV